MKSNQPYRSSQQSNQYDNDGFRDRGFGGNFGQGAEPYGEDYGEETPYPGEYDVEDRPGQKRIRRDEGRSPRDIGFRFSDGRHDSEISGSKPDDQSGFTRRAMLHGERNWWDKTGDELLSWFGDDYAERRRRQDHRGKGPKNYRRSDDRIRDDINDRLTDDWQIDASDIGVAVENGDVILTGFVPDKFQKRRAEDIAEKVTGVTNVENRIRVVPGGGF